MAHFKRGKCRRQSGRAIRGSQASFRARYGMKPVRLPLDWWRLNTDIHELWHPKGRHGNHGRGIRYQYSMMNSYPAWWDRIFHTRPTRAAEKHLLRAVRRGIVDADDAAWPIHGKPHIYYW